MQSDVRMACRMLAHNRLGPIREERSLKEALAEYERIECEDVPTMRIDPRARGSNKIRGDELESALSVRNLALLGRILAFAASRRTESRGAHFRARLSRHRRCALARSDTSAIGCKQRYRALCRSCKGIGCFRPASLNNYHSLRDDQGKAFSALRVAAFGQ